LLIRASRITRTELASDKSLRPVSAQVPPRAERPADCERRERQREMKDYERCAYGQTARSAFFRGVEPEAAQNSLATREGSRRIQASAHSRPASTITIA
jgi:hypothetical protein